MSLVQRAGARWAIASRARGFSLLEVLIALVLLSVGLLGLAGLQTTSLANSQSALLRSQAVTMGYSILDKIRANREAAEHGGYDTTFDDEPSGDSSVAASDLSLWKKDIATLPGGQGRIARDASDRLVVVVRWKARAVLDGSNQKGVDYESIRLSTMP